MRTSRGRMNWAVVAMAALMCVAAANRWQHSEPTDTETFQADVRKAWAGAPKVVGNWVGSDIPLPTAAVKVLRPNAQLNRRYQNVVSGEEISVLAIDCGDARDMEGHYPPNCYPGNGWILKSITPTDWCNGAVRGNAYEFADGKLSGSGGLWVAGTFILRHAGTARDMKEMRIKARQGGTRYYGVAQVQVVVPQATTSQRRKEIAEQFFTAFAPLMESAGCEPIAAKQPNLERSGR